MSAAGRIHDQGAVVIEDYTVVNIHDEPGPKTGARVIDLIVVHHSVSATTTTPEQIAAWHKARGFRAPGYHYLIREDERGVWQVIELRRADDVGAHCEGHNAHSIGICVAGDYTRIPLSEGARSALLGALTWGCRAFNLSSAQVKGHGELSATACPGFAMAPIREALDRALSGA